MKSHAGQQTVSLPSRHQSGFTLLELMLALTIFALISVMSFSGLNSVLRSRDVIAASADQLATLQTAMITLQRDLEQAVPRPVRDELGGALPAWQGGAGNQPMLELTRGGWANPRAEAISDLKRVGYTLEDRLLTRLSWRVLDRTPDTVFTRYPLLENVESIQMRFLDEAQIWQVSWPPAGAEDAQTLLPLAVEITLELEDIGEIQRIFRVSG